MNPQPLPITFIAYNLSGTCGLLSRPRATERPRVEIEFGKAIERHISRHAAPLGDNRQIWDRFFPRVHADAR